MNFMASGAASATECSLRVADAPRSPHDKSFRANIMASARITCPDCKSVLKPAKPVPDGKKVKCPKCGNMFPTPGLVEDEDDLPRKKATGQETAKRRHQESRRIPTRRPRKPAPRRRRGERRRRLRYISDEEKAEEDKPEIEYAPDMSIKDLRGPAQAAVVKPSNLHAPHRRTLLPVQHFPHLLCRSGRWSSAESVVDWEKVLAKHGVRAIKPPRAESPATRNTRISRTRILEIVQEANEKAVKDFVQDGFPPLGRLWMMGLFILVLIYNAIAIVGAVSMQNLELRRWGIASSIMMFLPMVPAV